jgi:hypothetical protein
MNKPGYMKTFVCSMGLLGASSGWALTPQLPQILYGTSTPVSSSNQFALAATLPEGNDPRSHYVVIAEVDDANSLNVLAWQDTTTSLELLSGVGLTKYSGVVTVAAAGLDPYRVVTADVDVNGTLSLNTWGVEESGVTWQAGSRTAEQTALPSNVSIAAIGGSEVVVAYISASSSYPIVQAWTIAADGFATANPVVGTEPLPTDQISVAAINTNRVVTAAETAETFIVTTWKVDSTGVTQLNQVISEGAVSSACGANPRQQNFAVAAGETFRLTAVPPFVSFLQAAFTPVLNPLCQLQDYYWGISTGGTLTLESTTPPLGSYSYAEVAASMLPNNIPITSYAVESGTGFGDVFIDWYTGSGATGTTATYNNPSSGALAVDSVSTGTDANFHSFFSPYNAYFVSAGQFDSFSSSGGLIVIKVLSYPEPPLFLGP